MIANARITINASRDAIWAAMTDIEHAANFISGIESVEMVDKPASGLVGMRWRETRILFGKPATAEKWITDAVDKDYYNTRAESDGFIFLSTTRIAEENGGITLSTSHNSQPQTLGTKIMSIPMSIFFKSIAEKALLKDLVDIKTAVETHEPR